MGLRTPTRGEHPLEAFANGGELEYRTEPAEGGGFNGIVPALGITVWAPSEKLAHMVAVHMTADVLQGRHARGVCMLCGWEHEPPAPAESN